MLPEKHHAVTFPHSLTMQKNDASTHRIVAFFHFAGYLVMCARSMSLHHYESRSCGFEGTPQKQSRFSTEINYMPKRRASILNPSIAASPQNLRSDVGDVCQLPL